MPLHWLPDPTKGPDDTFQPLDNLLGTETTDRDCPGLNAKGTATENDKKHKGVLVAGMLNCIEAIYFQEVIGYGYQILRLLQNEKKVVFLRFLFYSRQSSQLHYVLSLRQTSSSLLQRTPKQATDYRH